MRVSALDLDGAVATAVTGDIWLFRGRSIADRAIQTATNSPVNHVGMVVAIDDLPPLLYDPGRFWSGDRIELVPPYALSSEIEVPSRLAAEPR
ncbi:MAG: hypothetical protein ACRD0A_01970 [Acidimicrobiales bacterium]